MTEHGKGVMLFDDEEPRIHGYLIIGDAHYQIIGQRISPIRTNLTVKKISETQPAEQGEMFDGSSESGQRKCDSI